MALNSGVRDPKPRGTNIKGTDLKILILEGSRDLVTRLLMGSYVGY